MNNNVFGLNVSVDDVPVVQVVEGGAHLSDNALYFRLRKWSRFPHFLVEISRIAEFHDKIDSFVGAETAIKLDNVSMVKFHVNLNFSDERLFIDFARNCGLEDFFEGIKCAGKFMLGDINRSKGTFSTKVENVEVIDG